MEIRRYRGSAFGHKQTFTVPTFRLVFTYN